MQAQTALAMTTEQRYTKASEQIVAKVLDDEGIVIDMVTGLYYSLEGCAAVVWQGIESGKSVLEIEQQLLDTYQVDAVEVHQDLLSLVQELLTLGLIRPA